MRPVRQARLRSTAVPRRVRRPGVRLSVGQSRLAKEHTRRRLLTRKAARACDASGPVSGALPPQYHIELWREVNTPGAYIVPRDFSQKVTGLFEFFLVTVEMAENQRLEVMLATSRTPRFLLEPDGEASFRRFYAIAWGPHAARVSSSPARRRAPVPNNRVTER
jgi:hypothetical protein